MPSPPWSAPTNLRVYIMKKFENLDWRIGHNSAGVFVKKEQNIPDEFIQTNKAQRIASSNEKMGNYHKLASIPVAVADKWMREGFNIYDGSVPRRRR